MPNLRIVSNNLADTGTLSGTTGAGTLVLANLRKDAKSLVWRVSATTATITLILPTSQLIRFVGLAFTNLTANATMSVSGAGSTVSAQACVPAVYPKPFDWGTAANGANTFTYGGGNFARLYFAGGSTTSITITINDPSNPDGYIEASRLIVGDYWEPTYNVDIGASANVVDQSTNNRSDAGDLITDRGSRHRTMTVALSTLTAADRSTLYKILNGNGMSRAMFASVYPQSADGDLERDHQMYCKLSELSQISYQFINMFSGNLTFEEV